MFVVSVSKRKIYKSVIIGGAVILIVIAFVSLLCCVGKVQYFQSNAEYSTRAATEEDILSFISNCGWQVEKEPVEVRDVVIPETFDEVYNSYNEIQLNQGFDLSKYAGQRVKRWTYTIKNYPNTTPEDDFIRINILVSDDEIIGGDVCSVKLDGFMHGFNKE